MYDTYDRPTFERNIWLKSNDKYTWRGCWSNTCCCPTTGCVPLTYTSWCSYYYIAYAVVTATSTTAKAAMHKKTEEETNSYQYTNQPTNKSKPGTCHLGSEQPPQYMQNCSSCAHNATAKTPICHQPAYLHEEQWQQWQQNQASDV
jgi:hypothetical protein